MVSFCSNKLKDEQLSIQGSGCLGGQDWCVQKDMLQIMLQDSFYHPKNRGVLWFIPEKNMVVTTPWWPNKFRVSINTQHSKKRHSTQAWLFKVNAWLLKLDWRKKCMTLLDIVVKTWVSYNRNPEHILNPYLLVYSLPTSSNHYLVESPYAAPAHLQVCHRPRSARCLTHGDPGILKYDWQILKVSTQNLRDDILQNSYNLY